MRVELLGCGKGIECFSARPAFRKSFPMIESAWAVGVLLHRLTKLGDRFIGLIGAFERRRPIDQQTGQSGFSILATRS